MKNLPSLHRKTLEVDFYKPTLLVFCMCLVYWIYLICAAQIEIKHDAIGYEQLGTMLYKQGWVEYFRTGPNREPIYPFLISISMRTADGLSISYHLIQKIIQVALLFATQILVFFILRKIKIKPLLEAVILLYVGFSPAIINAAFSLFSEIASYPFVPGIIIASALSWRSIHSDTRRSLSFSALAAFLFAMATFSRGVFYYIYYVFLIPFIVLMVVSFVKEKRRACINSIISIISAVVVFHLCIIPYKWMNKIYNGQYEITDRSVRLLYGNASKRARPLTSRVLLAHLASIPGSGVCQMFFNYDECKYCEFQVVDGIHSRELPPLLTEVPIGQVNKKIVKITTQLVFKHPFQYVTFMFIEGARLFFWESTRIGNVIYPVWLQNLFEYRLFKDPLRLLVSLMSIFGFIYLFIYVSQNITKVFSALADDCLIYSFFILLMIILYIGCYSLFSTVTRYALPIAPLNLISIALLCEQVMVEKKQINKFSHKT